MSRLRNHANRSLPPNLYVRNDGYYSYRDPNTRKEYGLGRIKKEAISQAIEANLQFLEGDRLLDRMRNESVMMLHAWLDKYQIIISNRGLKENSLKEYMSRVKFIRNGFSNIPIDEVKTKDIADFLGEYVAAGKGRTAKLMRSMLLDIFREAIANGHISVNPVDSTKVRRVEVKRSRLSLADFLVIREVTKGMSPWLSLSTEIALITGQRVSDIAKMKWSDIYDEKLHVEQKKTGFKVALPLGLSITALGLSLQDVIDRCHQRYRNCETIIATRTGSELIEDSISKAFTIARDKTGLKWEKSPPSFHEIRSLAARLYSEERGSDFAQKVLGHKSQAMTAVYRDNRGSEWSEVVL